MDSLSELFHTALALDVHEEGFRIVIEKMVVQRGDGQARVEQHAHHRVDFILEQDQVAHDHRLSLSLLASSESSPSGEAHKGGHFPFVHGDGEIATGGCDLENLFLLVEGALEAGDFLDLGGIQSGGDHRQANTEHGECGDEFHGTLGHVENFRESR